MERTIISRRDVPAESQGRPEGIARTPDDYSSRLLKYIPTEVIALYLTLASLLHSAAEMSVWWEWCIFVLGVIATSGYLRWVDLLLTWRGIPRSTAAYSCACIHFSSPFSRPSYSEPGRSY